MSNTQWLKADYDYFSAMYTPENTEKRIYINSNYVEESIFTAGEAIAKKINDLIVSFM